MQAAWLKFRGRRSRPLQALGIHGPSVLALLPVMTGSRVNGCEDMLCPHTKEMKGRCGPRLSSG